MIDQHERESQTLPSRPCWSLMKGKGSMPFTSVYLRHFSAHDRPAWTCLEDPADPESHGFFDPEAKDLMIQKSKDPVVQESKDSMIQIPEHTMIQESKGLMIQKHRMQGIRTPRI
ncbi:unnamed protein product [Nesidiocoris tenuis]|uniref:Uncharacterized protein n=1 Tax=Nesidiocoris tenuis TaxID=355587 RepID=A0A6H5GU30_9HEMI|nr:unnamed protein product [Nesidiocoris tenuis]